MKEKAKPAPIDYLAGCPDDLPKYIPDPSNAPELPSAPWEASSEMNRKFTGIRYSILNDGREVFRSTEPWELVNELVKEMNVMQKYLDILAQSKKELSTKLMAETQKCKVIKWELEEEVIYRNAILKDFADFIGSDQQNEMKDPDQLVKEFLSIKTSNP